MTVTKRDGRKVPFDIEKIRNAITSAFQEVYDTVTSTHMCLIDEIAQSIEKTSKDYEVEEIQDAIEKKLMRSKYKEVAKAYILYRENRTRVRRNKSKLIKQVSEKLTASNVQNQNANIDEHSFGGRMGEANEVVTKQYALDNLVSEKTRENHLNNRVYIHDLGSYAIGNHNCLTIPFDDLLAKGFTTRQVDIRPANSVSTALQLIAVIFQLQSLMQFGGCSASHVDWTLVPYVRKSFWKHIKDGSKYIDNKEFKGVPKDYSIDRENYNCSDSAYQYAMDMTEKEIKQGVEALYHNLNSLQSRSGNQLPFTSINYGTCTLPEGRMVIKALLEGSIKGVGKYHRTSIFPCGIFQLKKGINRKQGEPNYDLYQLALKSTAQRLYPNYANCDWSGNAGYDENDPRTIFSTMGCRTANGWDINGFGQLKDGRGNIAPTTIILPTLAMEAVEKNGDIVEDFMNILDEVIHEAKDSLIDRFNYIASQSAKSAQFMYENDTMAGYVQEEGIISALKHGTLAIGQLGLAETLQILVGCDHTEEKGMQLAKRIEQLFKDRCNEFKEEYKLNFGVYMTPAENLCYTAMSKFKDKYGVIGNVSSNDFFTNSMHVPVWKNIDCFEKIDLESQLTGYSSAGCITYVELPSGIKNNLGALEQIVNYAMDKDIPYFAVNVPIDNCMDCGYSDEIGTTCPECGSDNIQRLRRVTGYLTGSYKDAFNKGKQQEVEMRRKHFIFRGE